MADLLIRQSLLGSVDKCLRSAQYSIEGADVPPAGSVQRSLGTGYHKAMEVFYEIDKREGFDPEEDSLSIGFWVEDALNEMRADMAKADPEHFKWSKELPTIDEAEDRLARMVRAYFEGGHFWPAEFEVVGVEEAFTFDDEQTGLRMHGTMDLVLRDPAGWIIIVDHKTCAKKWDQSKHKPRKQNQPGFYRHAAKRLWPEATGYRFVYDVQTYKGEFERRISDPTDAHEFAVIEKAQQFAALYRGMRSAGLDLPVNPSSNLCSPNYCDFWTICPQGAALDT